MKAAAPGTCSVLASLTRNNRVKWKDKTGADGKLNRKLGFFSSTETVKEEEESRSAGSGQERSLTFQPEHCFDLSCLVKLDKSSCAFLRLSGRIAAGLAHAKELRSEKLGNISFLI